MNKKGFTLIELLAIIVVIGIILAIAVPSIIKVVNKNNERELELKKETILSAAELYGQDYPSIYDANFKATITVRELLENGYLDADVSNNTKNCENEEKGCIINPVTKDSINDEIIYIMKSTMKIQAIWEGDFPSITFDKLTFTLKYNVESSEFKYPEDYDLLKGVETNMNKEDIVITNEGVLINRYDKLSVGTYRLTYTVSDIYGNIVSKNRIVNIELESKKFDHLCADQEYVIPASGTYLVKAYGAQGGKSKDFTVALGGKGGYVEAILYLTKGDTLIINTGGQDGCNGGGVLTDANPGGGATTIKLKDGDYLIIAAGGGGGGLEDTVDYIGGSGGEGDSKGGKAGINGGGASSKVTTKSPYDCNCEPQTSTCCGSCKYEVPCGTSNNVQKYTLENPIFKNEKSYTISSVNNEGGADVGKPGTGKPGDSTTKCYETGVNCSKCPRVSCTYTSCKTCYHYYYGTAGSGGTSSIASGVESILLTKGEHSGNGYLTLTYTGS